MRRAPCQQGFGSFDSAGRARTDDRVPDGRVTFDDPGDRRRGASSGYSVSETGGEGADDDEAGRHRNGATEHERTTTEAVDEEDGRDGEGDSESVLDRRGDESGLATLETGGLCMKKERQSQRAGSQKRRC